MEAGDLLLLCYQTSCVTQCLVAALAVAEEGNIALHTQLASTRLSPTQWALVLFEMLNPIRFRLLSGLTRVSGAGLCPTTTTSAGRYCRHQLRTFSCESARVKVLYDGLCPICVTEIQFLQFLQRKKPEKVDFIDISLPGYDGRKYKEITYEMAMEEMHVIDKEDKVHRGVPAFAVMYSAVGLSWLARLMTWPPVRPFMDKSYAVFARNRLKWTGRGDECKAGRCEIKSEKK